MKALIALLCGLLLTCLTGCGGGDGAAEPTPLPEVPNTPAKIVMAPTGDVTAKDVTVIIHGEENVISMTPVDGSFASHGGPDFRIWVEQSRYQVNDLGSCCYVTLSTGMSGDVYIELGYLPDTRGSDVDTTFLDDYGIMRETEDLGTEQLGDKQVHHLRGRTVQNVFDAYLLDTEGGCVTMVMSNTTETAAHRARLTASLESLEIFE